MPQKSIVKSYLRSYEVRLFLKRPPLKRQSRRKPLKQILLRLYQLRRAKGWKSSSRSAPWSLKSVEEYLGVKDLNRENKPIIPGVFDLLIPPGTPRKIVLKMAKNFNLDVIRRDDIYVPIGVSDVERDILAFRGDMKTVNKLEKILLKELEDYERTGKVEGFKVIP